MTSQLARQLVAVFLAMFAASCTGEVEGSAPTTTFEAVPSSSVEEVLMPDMLGQDLSDLEKEVGEVQGLAWAFVVHYVPNEAVAMGSVISQRPAPGLAVAGQAVTIEVSDGGPVTAVAVLPTAVAEVFQLRGIPRETPVRLLSGDHGPLYKTDDLLVAENCADLSDAVYRFADTSYGEMCLPATAR